MSDRRRAYKAFATHRHYQYRGCGPHWNIEELPGMSLGDETLPTEAWLAPHDEPQKVRLAREKAALAVCAACPALAACLTYALTEDGDGRLVEPHDIWGGMLSLDRHRALVERRRNTGPVTADRLPAEARSAQKRAVLRALAKHTTPESVADAAGLDVRTANWQRSKLATLLGLDKRTATRGQLLDTARDAGLLDQAVRMVPCDGAVPAVPPPADAPRSHTPARPAGEQLQLDLDPKPALRLITQPARTAPARLESAA